jgi:hypothetical protein
MAKPKKRKKKTPYAWYMPTETALFGDCAGKAWDFDALCAYLTALDAWTAGLVADYTRLRKAVCNLEAVALLNLPADATKVFCGGGAGGDPTPPPKAPKWT